MACKWLLYPTGVILPFLNKIPREFLLCDGRAIDRVLYSELFDLIGCAFGEGDGSTTFNLPKYDQLFFRGVKEGKNINDFVKNSYKKHIHKIELKDGGGHTSHYADNCDTEPYIFGSWGSDGGFLGWNLHDEDLITEKDGAHSHDIVLEDYKGSDNNYPDHVPYLWGIKW